MNISLFCCTSEESCRPVKGLEFCRDPVLYEVDRNISH